MRRCSSCSLSKGIDKDVVYKNDHKLIQVWLKNPVHEIHEDGWCISQPKRHDSELKVSVSGPECSLQNVRFSHPQLMIACPKIDLRETSRTTQLIEQVIDAGHRIYLFFTITAFSLR